MTGETFLFDPENKVDYRHGHLFVLGTVVGFGLFNVLVTQVGKPRCVKSDAWRWNNLLISWIHALISGTWDIFCLYNYPEMFDDLVHHINYSTYLLAAFSTGYFIYDFLDMVCRKKVIANWQIMLHHIAVVSMFYYNVHSKMCIGYNVLALMAEINSFFLHSRKLLHMLEFDFRDRFYQTVCALNLVTFFFCRGTSLVKSLHGLFTEYDNVPILYWRFLGLSLFVLTMINPVLFVRLIRSDVLRNFSNSSKKKEQEKTILNGNNNQADHIKSN